MFEGKGKTEIL